MYFYRKVIILAIIVSLAVILVPPISSTIATKPFESTIYQKTELQQGNSSHPRLWVTQDDIPRLQSWAVDSNPLYSEGLALLADFAKSEMDAGAVPDSDEGSITWEQYPIEMYAELFAFMSLVSTDDAVRDDYAQRARSILMYVMEQAILGQADGEPFRDGNFTIYDRSRWWGEGWALTVDWIYPYLSAEDKATIRTVFLRWAEENMNADTTDYNHPEPQGIVNDPALLSDSMRLRWAANNYYLSHMRNIGLMALAFDPEDDPNGELTGYLEAATGAWLYTIDHVLRNDARGGFSPEGWEYGPESLGYTAQFMYALYTAGQADPSRWGPQVVFENNPFWDQTIPAFLHSLSPDTTIPTEFDWIGDVYQPAWYGDGQHYWSPEFIGVFGPLGLYDYKTGNSERLNAIRWIQTHTPPGGEEFLTLRVGGTEVFRDAILYFMLFAPDAPAPTDPRNDLALGYFAEGIGHLLARTSWDEDAEFFAFHLGWNNIDHQLAEGGQFEFYRNGEWLTKGRVGWDGTSEPYGCNIGRSDYHNTLALENSLLDIETGHFLHNCQQHGSQLIQSGDGDGVITASSFGDRYVYVSGDMTGMYNSVNLSSTDILHASRSVIWLQPDHIIIFDRATSQTEGQYKRFWMNTSAEATVNGKHVTVTTENGQHLFLTNVLPTDGIVSTQAMEPFEDEVAREEPMTHRVLVESSSTTDVRFLNVIQGADGGANPDEVTLIESANGTPYTGVSVNGTVVVFPVDFNTDFSETTFVVPEGTGQILISGLVPNGEYDVVVDDNQVTVTIGSTLIADSGGVLVVTN